MTIGKIKITQEQADAIEEYLKAEHGDVAKFLDEHAEVSAKEDSWVNKYEPLNDFSQADLARALLIGYEVGVTYKVGDWVADNQTKRVHRVIHVYFNSVGVEGMTIGNLLIRHATNEEIKAEKERRVWKSIGRDVGEFRKGDVAITLRGASICIRSVEAFERSYGTTDLKGIYPAESFVSFGDGDDK